jgi:hypothetical protein
MPDLTNVQLGVCEVTFNGVNLGHTKNGVELTYEPEHHDVTVDKYGNTVVQKYLIGEKLMAKVALAEFTIANLGVAIPQGAFAGAANSRRTIGAAAGKKATDDSAQLVLHPINEGTRRHDVVIHKAYVGSTIVLNHKNDEEKIIEVEFHALLDETKSDGNYLGFIGDSTL